MGLNGALGRNARGVAPDRHRRRRRAPSRDLCVVTGGDGVVTDAIETEQQAAK